MVIYYEDISKFIYIIHKVLVYFEKKPLFQALSLSCQRSLILSLTRERLSSSLFRENLSSAHFFIGVRKRFLDISEYSDL